MAALAYVLLPVSGMLAYFMSTKARVRFHGAQSVVLGLVWSTFLYASSWLSAVVTQIVFGVGAASWIGAMIVTAAGRDPRLPLLGDLCARASGLDDEV